MSRLAKKTLLVPSDIKIEIRDNKVSLQGPQGQLCHTFPHEVKLELNEGKIRVIGDYNNKMVRMKAGLCFALIKNMMQGVTKGYAKELEVVGVGHKVQLQGNNLNFQLGFSHPILFPIPEGIKIQIPKPTQILIQGIDKERVGNVAAQIRDIYPPEPYKGKGIRYKGEHVRRKLGKAATATK